MKNPGQILLVSLFSTIPILSHVRADSLPLDPRDTACQRFDGFKAPNRTPPKILPEKLRYTEILPDGLKFSWACPEGTRARLSYFCCSCSDNTSHTVAAGTGFYVLKGIPAGDYAWSPSCHERLKVRSDGPLLVARLGSGQTPRAEPTVKMEDPEVVAHNKQLEKRKADLQHPRLEYEKNPESENAHRVYLQLLMMRKEWSKARQVIASLKRLSPESAIARVAERQLRELQRLPPDSIDPDVGHRHWREMGQAIHEDTFRQSGLPREVQTPSRPADGAIRASQEKRIEYLIGRYGDICKDEPQSLEVRNMTREFDYKFLRLRIDKGEDVIKATLPSLLKEFGSIPTAYIRLSQLFLSSGDYERSEEIAQKGLTRFPTNIELRLLKDRLTPLATLRSIEQKSREAVLLDRDLSTIGRARVECLTKRVE